MGWYHPKSQSSVGQYRQSVPDADYVLPLEETSSFHPPLRNMENITSVLPLLLEISFHGTFEIVLREFIKKALKTFLCQTMVSSH